MLDRWVNIFFLFTLVIVFITYGQADDHIRIIIAFVLAFVMAYLAFVLNWLTLDGASAAIIFGTIAYGIGGLIGAVIVLAFFFSGSLLTKGQKSSEGFLEKNLRRNGSQVWANGFWFSFWIFFWYLFHHNAFLIAAIASIAMATADTWATEIGGVRLKAKAWLITSRKEVPPGTDGGISVYGTLAAFIGALFIALIYGILNMEASFWYLLIIISSGFLGSLIDSYLGARYQSKSFSTVVFTFVGLQFFYINNNVVNWLSAGIASVLSLATILILGI